MHQITKLKWFTSRIAVDFAKSIEARFEVLKWRCSWSNADRRCSNYIWVINYFIAYPGATYIKGLTIIWFKMHKLWLIAIAIAVYIHHHFPIYPIIHGMICSNVDEH